MEFKIPLINVEENVIRGLECEVSTSVEDWKYCECNSRFS
jgi:hypothetical protein